MMPGLIGILLSIPLFVFSILIGVDGFSVPMNLFFSPIRLAGPVLGSLFGLKAEHGPMILWLPLVLGLFSLYGIYAIAVSLGRVYGAGLRVLVVLLIVHYCSFLGTIPWWWPLTRKDIHALQLFRHLSIAVAIYFLGLHVMAFVYSCRRPRQTSRSADSETA